MEELLIVSLHRNEFFTTCKPEEAGNEIARAKEFYKRDLATVTSRKKDFPGEADYWQQRIEEYSSILQAGFEAITWEEYKKRQREKWLDKEPREITQEDYDYALNVLPPLRWIQNERYSMFFIGECTAMTFCGQYLYNKTNERYYYAMTDILDKSTWLDKMLGL